MLRDSTIGAMMVLQAKSSQPRLFDVAANAQATCHILHKTHLFVFNLFVHLTTSRLVIVLQT
jgi:hypothetical protein